MWQLLNIKATNLCAFRSLDYKFDQGHTTLVFGDNMDDDSQNSNGSGKSALIEAIAISITGETLRKVNIDEIINDSYDIAQVDAVLYNPAEETTMTVSRTLVRKKPQTVEVKINRGSVLDGIAEEIKQPSVAEYNRFILDTIGLSKDDIFSNFILTAKKYKSFLSSSDREKKEIINRFSNGILVDESIEALQNDMVPIQESCQKAENRVAECSGRVSALKEEIEHAISESASRSANKQARIDKWRQSISDKHSEIRNINEKISHIEERLDCLDVLDSKMQNLENDNMNFRTTYERISENLKTCNLILKKDYWNRYLQLQDDRQRYEEQEQNASRSLSELSEEMDSAEKKLDEFASSYDCDLAAINKDVDTLNDRIQQLSEMMNTLKHNEVEINRKRSNIYALIGNLEKMLAGVVICPKCKHEFLLSDNADIPKMKKELNDNRQLAKDIEKEINDNSASYNQCLEDGDAARQQRFCLDDQKSKLKRDFQKLSSQVANLKDSYQQLERRLKTIQSDIESTIGTSDNLRKAMFDDVFETIDEAVENLEGQAKRYKLEISNANGAIQSYEESIQEVENAVETDIVSSLKDSKTKYDSDFHEAVKDKELIERQLNELKIQESTFIEFKTHLANTKIDAISKITNDFLETIGSDIRVVFSGFTVLKSGKVRDRISISLLRDGMDCGSFDKFSRGEQTRVELACILAMHELTNSNCSEDKGLNLLVIDEILDAADEQGLTNVFKALNATRVTSLIVSHGNVAENYPNRLVVHKKNGISFIE